MRRDGSSPLARGLLVTLYFDPTISGIIPARAGFTRPGWTRWRTRADHPRSRGVYRTCRSGRVKPRGSSPLARGLRVGPTGRSPSSRIIPARAGFTGGFPPGVSGVWDHPRSRGVYSLRSASE